MSSFLSFRLNDAFVQEFESKQPVFGFTDAGGNSLGEIVFLSKYSRLKEDGTKERWYEVCRRVVEGMYSIQKDWAKTNVLPWNDNKAQRSAQEAFTRMFDMKWTPPGRGMANMGTYGVNGLNNSSALQNCGAVSTLEMTKHDPTAPFEWLMNVSMVGVGVGYDDRGIERGLQVHKPQGEEWTFLVPDSREGWAEAMKHKVESYLIPGKRPVKADTSQIREKGAPIKTFGGVAPGPMPLDRLMRQLDHIFEQWVGMDLTSRVINDIGNLCGMCVVSGGVRRSAELFKGRLGDQEFLDLKNSEVFPERTAHPDGWAWLSNNSVSVSVGQDLSSVIDGIKLNGEPGLIWDDVVKAYGRLADKPDFKDSRFAVFNPCAEMPLESYEMCTLVDIHLSRIEDKQDLLRTLKYAYLYAKSVTLLPTSFAKTNAVMQRNRRIGISLSGICDFVDNNNRTKLRTWADQGYQTVKTYDKVYSEWLCVRESIRTTTVKPVGTTSLVVGESPGVHWSPGGHIFNRAMRFEKDDPMVQKLRDHGYLVEDCVNDPATTVVAYFPIKADAKRSATEVSLFEKAALAADMQKWWSDNGVSVTLSFDAKREADDVLRVLEMHDGEFKAVSFLPLGDDVYPQQPYTSITEEVYQGLGEGLSKVDMDSLYQSGQDVEDEKFCTTDVCEMPKR